MRTKEKDTQEITSLKKRVKKLENKGGSRTCKLKRLYKVGLNAKVESTNKASLGDQEDASKQGRKIDDINTGIDITLVNNAVNDQDMFDVNDLAGEEVFVAKQGVPDSKKDNVVQVNTGATTVSTTSTVPVSALEKLKSKDKGKAEFDEEVRLAREKDEANVALIEEWNDIQAKIETDYELTQRLQVDEQEELIVNEKATLFQQLLEKRRNHFAAKRAEEKRNRPPTRAQQRSIMCTYLKNMAGWKPKDLKSKSFANI
ncbi:hypothetical protein Tco_1052713 [Tanacetum coccineum]